jgi:hypothetical protein
MRNKYKHIHRCSGFVRFHCRSERHRPSTESPSRSFNPLHHLNATIAAVVLLLFGGVKQVNGDSLKYEVVGDTVTIKDCKETASGPLAIPSIYERKPVTSIGDWAFIKCARLTSVTIPDSITLIGALAFRDCFGLKSVRIPDSITNIKMEAFSSCSNLTSIIFEGNAPFSFRVDAFSSVPEDAKIFINPGATGFGEKFAHLPVIILKELKINTFSKIDSRFSISFESNSGISYIIKSHMT